MKKGLFNRRIPTIFALIALLMVIGVSTILIQRGVFYIGKAAPDTEPQNFSVTNVTDTSFTTVFTTTGLVDAVLNINDAKTGKSIILDDRDKKTGAQGKYYSHHITVPNLTAETTYVFKLLVNGKEYINPSYAVKTGKNISQGPPNQNPLFGKVLLPDGNPGSDVIVVAKTDQSETVSAVTDSKGEFILPTNSLRNTESSDYLTLQRDTTFSISVFRQTMKASVTTTFQLAQNLPAITLLQQYVFNQIIEPTSTQSSQLSASLPVNEKTVDIVSPKQGESFVDQRPFFTGTSYPNSTITLSIPGVAEQQVLVKADGSWSYQTPSGIPQGKHTITITTTGPNSPKETITRNFTIFPQGSQVSESATPSATPVVKPTATATPTPTKKPTPTTVPITLRPTTTPSSSPSATLTPTIAATATPTSLPTMQPTTYYTPTKLPPIEKPGGIGNTAILTGISVALIIAGTALLFAL